MAEPPATDQPHAEISDIDSESEVRPDSPHFAQEADRVQSTNRSEPASHVEAGADDQVPYTAAATPDVLSEPCTPDMPRAASLASAATAAVEASSADDDEDEGQDSASDDGISVETRKRRRSRSASIVEGARRVCATAMRTFTSAL